MSLKAHLPGEHFRAQIRRVLRGLSLLVAVRGVRVELGAGRGGLAAARRAPLEADLRGEDLLDDVVGRALLAVLAAELARALADVGEEAGRRLHALRRHVRGRRREVRQRAGEVGRRALRVGDRLEGLEGGADAAEGGQAVDEAHAGAVVGAGADDDAAGRGAEELGVGQVEVDGVGQVGVGGRGGERGGVAGAGRRAVGVGGQVQHGDGFARDGVQAGRGVVPGAHGAAPARLLAARAPPRRVHEHAALRVAHQDLRRLLLDEQEGARRGVFPGCRCNGQFK